MVILLAQHFPNFLLKASYIVQKNPTHEIMVLRSLPVLSSIVTSLTAVLSSASVICFSLTRIVSGAV